VCCTACSRAEFQRRTRLILPSPARALTFRLDVLENRIAVLKLTSASHHQCKSNDNEQRSSNSHRDVKRFLYAQQQTPHNFEDHWVHVIFCILQCQPHGRKAQTFTHQRVRARATVWPQYEFCNEILFKEDFYKQCECSRCARFGGQASFKVGCSGESADAARDPWRNSHCGCRIGQRRRGQVDSCRLVIDRRIIGGMREFAWSMVSISERPRQIWFSASDRLPLVRVKISMQ
jgi:hypothetical protein